MGPTLLEFAGVEYAEDRFSGTSFTRLLYGADEGWTQDAFYTQSNGNEQYGIQRSVMTKEWKYVYNGFDFNELYDLKNDPEQNINLADRDEYDKIQKELSVLL